MAPFPDRDIEADVHNAGAFQSGYIIAEVFAHPPDLSVEPLGENDAETIIAEPLNFAFAGNGVQDRHPVAHFFNERMIHAFVNVNDVFFFVVVAGPQDFVDNIAVAGQ